MVSLPQPWHTPADVILASALIGGSVIGVSDLNPWIAFVGGLLGVFIGAVRVYQIIMEYLRKNDTKK